MVLWSLPYLFILLLSILNWRSVAANVPENDRIFLDEHLEAFQREGYLVVKELLDDTLLENLQRAAKLTVDAAPKIPFYFSVTQTGAFFGSQNCTAGLDRLPCEHDLQTAAFRQAALYSQLPKAAAELMQLDPVTQNLRVLRDVFLSKAVNDSNTCDWHVDDPGFWPESYISIASKENRKDQNGMNVWIALDDMPAQYRGSMAVAPGSHKAAWRHQAYLAIGQNRSEDGGRSKAEIIRKRQLEPDQGYPTCDMHKANPALRNRIEKTAKILDIKRGDVIFATRLLFHRTLTVTDNGLDYYNSISKEFLNRYSVRYVPGSARLPNGWSVEWSMVSNPANTGKTLDEVADDDATMYYPKVWPQLEDDIDKGLEHVASIMEDVKKKAHAEFVETIFGSTK